MPGRTTYMKLPYTKNPENLDFIVAGVPFDTLTTARGGTRLGPEAIRGAYGNNVYNPDLKIQISDYLEGADYGDIPVFNGNAFKTFDSITEHVEGFLRKGMTPVILGGDHSIAFPELRAYRNVFGKVAIVHFDSHSDTSYHEIDPEAPSDHGTPFFDAINDNCILTEHSIQVGMRGYVGTCHVHDFAKNSGMDMIPATELHAIGIDEAAARIRKRLAGVPVYVTFDIDFLDPAFAPGTGTPVIGGFTTAEALKLLRLSLTGLNIVGMDLVEVAPEYDPAEITCVAARDILREFTAILSYNKNILKVKKSGK